MKLGILTHNKLCGTREFKTVRNLMECMQAQIALPYFPGRLKLGDIYGSIGKYVGYQFSRFSRDCPIDVKIAFLAIMSTGTWQTDGHSFWFDFPHGDEVCRNWDKVKESFKKKRPIYVQREIELLSYGLEKERIALGCADPSNTVELVYNTNEPTDNVILYIHPDHRTDIWMLSTVAKDDGTIHLTFAIPKSVEYYIRKEHYESGLENDKLYHWSGSQMATLIDINHVPGDINTMTEYFDYVDWLNENLLAYA